MKVWVKDSTCLEKNLLFACYQAAHTKKPTEYSSARVRRERERMVLQIQSQMKLAKELLGFISANPNTVIGCYKNTKGMPWKDRDLVLATPEEKLGMLSGLLAEYEYGLEKDAKDELALCVTNSYGFGPFLYDKEASYVERREKPNVAELGLIFHLIYLFRYFTAESEPKQSKNNISDSGFFDDKLVVLGEMLDNGGKPCYTQVAALVNTTLNKRYKPADIKLRLKDLLSPSEKDKSKGYKKKYIVFAGWEITPHV
jgi:hypothetical protein